MEAQGTQWQPGSGVPASRAAVPATFAVLAVAAANIVSTLNAEFLLDVVPWVVLAAAWIRRRPRVVPAPEVGEAD